MRTRRLLAIAAILAWASPALAQGRRGGPGRDPQKDRRSPGELREGEAAPDFELARLDQDGKAGKKVKLSSFKGKKPVVLFFGSYT